MLKHYLTIGFRNLRRNPGHSLINLLGLALGMAGCLLMMLYVQDEINYDGHQRQLDRIMRVSTKMSLAGNQDTYALSSMAVGPELTARYPEVDTFARVLYNNKPVTIKREDRIFSEENVYMTDPQIFEVFTFQMIEGDPATALDQPRTVVLSASLANKYFGRTDILDELIELNDNEYAVKGVFEDLPSNTDLPMQAMTSTHNFPEQARQAFMTDWGRMAFYTFLLFQEPTSPREFEKKMDEFAEDRVRPFWEENSIDGEIQFKAVPLAALHFNTDFSYDTPKGNKTYLYLFVIVAVLILLIACINYINLAIAQSASRSTEVGIRKTSGAGRPQLIGQFIGESALLALMSLAVAVMLVELVLPFFNQLANKDFHYLDVFQPSLILTMLGIWLLVGLVAGSYPAFFLSGFQPVQVLKGQLSLGGKNWLRKSLVVSQFTVSVGLIIATMVIFEQMRYLKNQDLGFTKDQTMVIEVPNDTSIARRMPQLKAEMMAYPGVIGVANTLNGIPGQRGGALLMRVEVDGQLQEDQFNIAFVDADFLELMDISVLEGRNFSLDRGTDQQQAFIVNEAFVQKMGWQDPVGKRMQWGLMPNNQAANDGKVVGVVEDYHYASLHNSVEPLVLLFNPTPGGKLLVRMEGRKIASLKGEVEQKWQEFDPGHPMNAYFLDAYFNRQYQQEERLMEIFTYFSLLHLSF
ncbi:MAG: ABC transporter permease [Bacteroidota bacterium]